MSTIYVKNVCVSQKLTEFQLNSCKGNANTEVHYGNVSFLKLCANDTHNRLHSTRTGWSRYNSISAIRKANSNYEGVYVRT
jgi:hypothetical protein